MPALRLEDVGLLSQVDPVYFTSSSYHNATFTELSSNVYLVASLNPAKNQCTVELLVAPQPNADHGAASTSGGSDPLHVAGRGASPAPLPAFVEELRELFRVPRAIQVMEEEGAVKTLEMICDPNGRLPLRRGTTTQDGLAGTEAPPFVFLLVGTSTGTVLFCNALRGTILAIAHFNCRTGFMGPQHSSDHRRGSMGDGATAFGFDRTPAVQLERERRLHQLGKTVSPCSVVRFVPHVVTSAVCKNPSIIQMLSSSAEYAPLLQRGGATQEALPTWQRVQPSKPASADGTAKRTLCRQWVLGCVYVVHNNGYTVPVPRPALDVMMEVAQAQLDGHRPYLRLEWSPSTSLSPFPVVGPAADFALRMSSYFKLKSGEFSLLERTTKLRDHTCEDAAFAYRIQRSGAERDQNAPSFQQMLLVVGSSPGLAAYKLDASHEPLTAVRLMKETASLLKGVAVGLVKGIFGSLPGGPPEGNLSASRGSRSDIVASPKSTQKANPLERMSLKAYNAFFEGDAVFSRIEVDPTQQHAACYCTSGRIYLYDITTGVVWRVMKGCRSASCHWFFGDLFGRNVLMIAVFLPLRGVLEIHSVRCRQRVAACHVPSDAALVLRPDVTVAGAAVLLVLAGGVVKRVELTMEVAVGALVGSDDVVDSDRSRVADACPAAALQSLPKHKASPLDQGLLGMSSLALTAAEAHLRPSGAALQLSSRLKAKLRLCRKPDDHVALALQVPLTLVTQGSYTDFCEALALILSDLKERLSPGLAGDRTIPMHSAATENRPRAALRCSQCIAREGLQPTVTSLALPADGAVALRRPATPSPPHVQLEAGGSGPAPCSPPLGLTAAQSLNFLELYLACVSTYATLVAVRYGTPGANAPSREPLQVSAVPLPVVEAKETLEELATKLHASVRTVSCLLDSDATLLSAFASEFMAECTSTAATPPPPSREEGTASRDDRRELTAEEFVALFYMGGYRPELLTDHMMKKSVADNRLIAAELGDLFFGRGGLEDFAGQLQTMGTLGVQSKEATLVTLSWMVREAGQGPAAFFHTNPMPAIRQALTSCSDGVFLDAMEQMFVPWGRQLRTATQALSAMILFTVLRLKMKPASQSCEEGLVRLLRQLLHLRAVARRCSAEYALVEVEANPLSEEKAAGGGTAAETPYWLLQLSSLRPREPNAEALAWWLFERCAAQPAALLCINLSPSPVPQFMIEIYRITQCRRSCCVFPGDLPWNVAGIWSTAAFRGIIVNPLNQMAESLWGAVFEDGTAAWTFRGRVAAADTGGDSSSKSLSGKSSMFAFAALLVAMVAFARRELRPLLEATSQLVRSGDVPSTELFRSLEGAGKHFVRGSRSFKDYLSSCKELVSLIRVHLLALLAANSDEELRRRCCSVAVAVECGLTEDAQQLFPHVGDAAFRRAMSILGERLCDPASTEALADEICDAGSFLDVVAFFAVTLPQSGVHLTKCSVDWSAMYPVSPLALGALLDTHTAQLVVEQTAPQAMRLDARTDTATDRTHSTVSSHVPCLQARADFLHSFLENHLTLEATGAPVSQLAQSLSAALQLSSYIPDLPQVFLFDISAKRLASPQVVEQHRLSLTSRHLASGIALSRLRALIGCIFKYHVALKRKIPRDNKAAMQSHSLHIRRMLGVLPNELRQWIRQTDGQAPGEESSVSATPESGQHDLENLVLARSNSVEVPPAVTSSRTELVHGLEAGVLRSCCTASLNDFLLMDRLVQQRLHLGPSEDRDALVAVLRQLAQTAADGAHQLEPEELRMYAVRMPSIIEQLGQLL